MFPIIFNIAVLLVAGIGECLPCPENCKACDDHFTQCAECKKGFYMINKWKCDPCYSGCASCTTSNKWSCTSCQSGYFMSNGYCNQCNSQCLECSTSWSCTTCQSGYYLNNGYCNQCRSQCLECSTVSSCTFCQSGYYLNNGYCSTCSSPCLECSTPLSCTACQSGYYLNNGYCSPCSNPCLECSTSWPCTACQSGYYLNNGYCSQCSSPCLECSTSSSCTSCQSGYYLNNGYCSQCSSQCLECSTSWPCTACQPGYYLNNGYCSQCISQCLECSTSWPCTACQSGYYLNNGYCSQCSSQCLECSTSSFCTACQSGYSLYNGYCNQCSSSCIECSTPSSCSSCQSGYYLNYDHCEKCNSRCGECKSSSLCTSCQSGYYLDNGYCSQCILPCVECSISSLCTSCQSGYYHTEGTCVACDVTCSSCSNTTGACTSCPHSTFLLDGRCVLCGENCLSCYGSSGTCDKCKQEYYGDSCQVLCDKHCNENVCDHISGKCINGCKVGYFQMENECVNCPTNCTTCQNNDVCTSCTEDHHLNTLSDGSVVCSLSDETSPTFEQTQLINNSEGDDTFTGDTNSLETTPIIVGVVGAAVAILVVVAILLAVYYKRRSKIHQNSEATDTKSSNIVTYSVSRHVIEIEAGPIYSTPNKVKGTSSKAKKGAATQHTVSATYENTSLGQGPSPKITAYEDDDLLEETDGLDSDPTGGTVEGVYDTYYNTSGLLRRYVTVDTLVEVVAKKSHSDYENEFKTFPDDLARDYQEAVKPENAKKNRYKKVYPYDATRVVLKDGGDGDYINASYITGPTGNITYIAALGPTVAHSEGFSLFWRMVWQENVDKIVVLTKLNEGQKMKFERYWPIQGTPESYGPVEVQTVTEENFAEYTIRRFYVSLNFQQRTVYQAHYTAWPDRSIPDNLVSLLDFRHKVEALPTKRSGPMVVHCSAGIGRTGTYIALDLLIHEGQSSASIDGTAEHSVDVYGCVSALRGQRVYMVQNVDQYRYLHHALVHALTVDTGPLPNYQLYTCLSDEGKTRLAHQFKMLQRMEMLKEEDTAVVENRKKSHKNRPGADIPGDRHRTLLAYQGKSGDSDYINAVYLDGHVANRKFLIAQTPLQATVKDFLRLVFQEHVHCIVSMNPKDINDKHAGTYVPATEQELKIGTFTVRCLTCETKSNFLLQELKFQNRSGKGVKEITVQHIQYTGWTPGEKVPVRAESLVQTIREVEKTAGQHREPGPVLVHCLTGAERSCLFVTVSLLMEKATNDQAISVVNTVAQVRDRRPMAIPTMEQYIFCHECIAVSSQSAEYTNVTGTSSHDISLTSQGVEYGNVTEISHKM